VVTGRGLGIHSSLEDPRTATQHHHTHTNTLAHLEHVGVELLLQPLVGQVDAQLLKGVDVERLKAWGGGRGREEGGRVISKGAG
jgi:hypothetical protein